jgi:uncharacterized membrane protein YphA (DoxX/SURF4 family)
MNTLIWILQIYIAILFGYSGLMKGTQNREYLVSIGQTGVDNLPYPLIRGIAALEILGVIGIILPWALQILPILTPVSAIGFAIIMLLAAGIHYKRKEYKSVIGINLTTFLICILIAYIRFNELAQLTG